MVPFRVGNEEVETTHSHLLIKMPSIYLHSGPALKISPNHSAGIWQTWTLKRVVVNLEKDDMMNLLKVEMRAPSAEEITVTNEEVESVTISRS